jgi:hypothetical protein
LISNVQILEGGQAKIEAVRGTPEATMTRWLYPLQGGLVMVYEQDVEEEPELTRSYHAHTSHALGRYRVRFNYEEIVTYEDLPWWLQMTLKGGVTGVTTASTPPGFTYTFAPSGATDDLKTFTLKAGDPANIYTFSRCAVNRLTLRFDDSQAASWRLSAEIWARDLAAGATFDALTDRARERVGAKGTKLFVDAAGGTLGTTQVTGKLRSGSITIDNQLEEKAFSEDLTTAAADFARGEQLVTGEVVVEHKDDVEFALMRSGAQRRIRFERVGTNIGATPTTDKRVRIDVPDARWRPPTFGYTGQNKTATYGFMGYKNATDTVPITAAVVNALTVLP